jgi:hypothetical protein
MVAAAKVSVGDGVFVSYSHADRARGQFQRIYALWKKFGCVSDALLPGDDEASDSRGPGDGVRPEEAALVSATPGLVYGG